MNPIDFLATQPQYEAHLEPIREAVGGRFSVQSAVGGGTRLDVTLRYNSASAGA